MRPVLRRLSDEWRARRRPRGPSPARADQARDRPPLHRSRGAPPRFEKRLSLRVERGTMVPSALRHRPRAISPDALALTASCHRSTAPWRSGSTPAARPSRARRSWRRWSSRAALQRATPPPHTARRHRAAHCRPFGSILPRVESRVHACLSPPEFASLRAGRRATHGQGL